MKKGFENIRDVNRREYLKLVLEEVRKEFGVSLISFIVYGSVARGDDDKLSDVDVLLILDTSESYSERCSRLAKILTKIYAHKLTLKLIEEGYNVFIEFYPLSLNEALNFRPIYLDMVDDAVILYDKGVFEKIMFQLLKLFKQLGSRRIWLDKKTWFWELKPDIKFGEVIKYEFEHRAS